MSPYSGISLSGSIGSAGRINRGRADGSLDWHEYKRVTRELTSIKLQDEGDRASDGGHLDGPTRANLEARLDQLNDQIRWIQVHNEPGVARSVVYDSPDDQKAFPKKT